MLKLLYSVLLTLFLTISTANAQEWVEVSRTDKTLFFMKSNSVVTSESDDGTKIVASIGKTINVSANKIEIMVWYVSITDCILGRGTLNVLNTDGKIIGKYEFIFQDKRVSSNISEIMCRVVQDSYIKRSKPV